MSYRAVAIVLLSAATHVACLGESTKTTQTQQETPTSGTTPGTQPTATQPVVALTQGNGSQTTNPNGANANTPFAAVKAVPWPNIGFVNNASPSGAKTVALTFDDGPDGTIDSNTTVLLDQLKTLNLKATFFLCGNLYTDVKSDPYAQNNLKRIVAEGHHWASHTDTHPTFTQQIAAQIPAQFDKNNALYQSLGVFGPSFTGFTMYRVPYGIPFQEGSVSDVAAIGPLTAKYGVHIGWGIDPKDWQCAQKNLGSECIMTQINRYLDKGATGPILMHAVHRLTAQTLPQVVSSINAHGYKIVMVEDLVMAKYGASSADLAKAQIAAKFDDKAYSDAAVAALKESKWFLHTDE